MAEYTPPVSPEINLVFKGIPYTPPVSPSIDLKFGVADDGGGEQGILRANYTILLTM